MAKKIINVVYDVNDKELTEAKKKIQDIEKETKKSESSFKKVGQSGVAAFGLIASAAAALGLAAIGQKIFSITAEFQKLGAVLTNTLGSRSAAQKALKDIQTFASQTPFSVVELTASFVKLANQGFKPTTAELRKLGDLASAQGKSFEMLTEAIIDAQTGEFERLKEFGIRASKEGDNVKFTFKGVETQAKFTADSIRAYILSLGDLQGVSGGMAAISATLDGKLSNLGDNFDALFNTIGSSSSGLIGGFLDLANNALGSLNDALNDNIGNLRSEQAELNVLVGAITATNISEEVRSTLITQLNQKYPDFLKNLNAEKVTNEQLSLRLKDVNDQFFRKIALQEAEDRFKDSQEEILDLIDEEVVLRKKLEEQQIKQAELSSDERKGVGIDQGRVRVASQIAATEQAITDVQTDRAVIQKELTDKLIEYNKALDLFKSTTNDYFSGEGVVTKTSEDVDAKALADLKKAADERFAASDKIFADLEKQKQESADRLSKIESDRITRELKQQADGYDAEQEALRKANEEEYTIAEEAANKRLELERQRQQLIKQLKEQLIRETLEFALTQREVDTQGIQDYYDNQITLAGDNDKAKEQLELERDKKLQKAEERNKQIQKKNARTKILIDTAIAVIKTFSQFGWPGGIIPAALMAGIGLVAVGNVNKYKDGGWIEGEGTTTSDSVPIMASRDEFMVKAVAAKNSPNLLEAINDRKIDDRILQVAANGGSQVNVFDDSRIIEELRKGRVDYEVQGYSLMKSERRGSNFKLLMKAKNQGYR